MNDSISTPANLTQLGDVDDLRDYERQTLVLHLDIYDECIVRTTFDSKGKAMATDEISPLDLAQAFSGLDAGTGILPPDTLFFHRQGSTCHIGIFRQAESRCRLRIVGEEIPIPLPPLVFTGQDRTYRVYAVAENGWPAADTPLYHAPFPNVYMNGAICPGSVKFPACGPDTIHMVLDLFLQSDFNRDLSGGKSVSFPDDVIVWWRRLLDCQLQKAHAGIYPVSDLVEMGTTLGDLMEQ